MIASNGRIHDELAGVLRETRPEAERRHLEQLRDDRLLTGSKDT
jgi:hypothetical protein